VITQAAEYRSEKIKTLVYLAAYLLQNGEHILQVGSADSESLLTANVIVTEDQSYCTVKEEALREVFYGYCSNKVIEYAKQNLVPQATAPLVTPIRTTVSNFGSIHRVYITCLQDKAVSPTEQEKMYNALPCEKVIPMNTDHSAFFSAPEELAKNLLSI
jgi:hypothetical protein